jgi:hypothetical protein
LGDEFPFFKTLIFHVTSAANKMLVAGFLELPANKYGKTRNSGIGLTTNAITAEYYFGSNFLPGLKIIK